MVGQNPFKWRHFQAEIIILCVRWYLRYSLSYRDLEEIMQERGLSVDHTTISRWVQKYAPELEKRCRPHLKTCNDSWRVDETRIASREILPVGKILAPFPYPHVGVCCKVSVRFEPVPETSSRYVPLAPSGKISHGASGSEESFDSVFQLPLLWVRDQDRKPAIL